MKKSLKVLFSLIFIFILSHQGWAQINISPGNTVAESFTIGTSITANLPSNWKADKNTTARTLGTFSSAVTATELRAGNSMSSSAGNGIYNYGAGDQASVTDRSIGWISSSSATKSGNLYAYLKNNGSSTITSFTISYDVEKYRKGSNSAGYSIQLYYSTDGSSWTSAGTDFLTSFSADADNNGYVTAPGATSSINSKTLTVSVAASSSIYLAWNYSVTSGTTTSNAQGLGIDNVSITANPSSTVPSAPTINSITPGNKQLTVAFTAGSDGGSTITDYQYQINGVDWVSIGTSTNPFTITGLTNGSTYTVKLRAINAIGNGAEASSTGTPRTTPGAPTITGITPDNQQLSVDFSAGSDGGNAISNYEYSLNNGSSWTTRTPSSTSSPIVITGLTNSTTYQVKIRAVNGAGSGTESNMVEGTPVAPSSPTITVSGTISALSTTYGTPSSNSSFTVSGIAMAEGITITPPIGFEVSTNSDFSSNVGTNSSPLVVGSAGTIDNTTIYIRLQATAAYSGSPYSGNVTLSSSGADNKTIVTSSSTVSQKGITVTNISINNKTYDGNTTATISGTASYSGLVNGETFSVTGSPSAAFSDKNVGDEKSVSVSGYTAPSTNYSITQPTGLKANISKATLSVSGAVATNRAYNGTVNVEVSGGTFTGKIEGDNVTLSATGTVATADVGNGKEVTLSLTGSDAGNYNLTQPGITVNITKADQTITFGTLPIKASNDANFDLTASSSSGLTVSYTSSNTTVATISGSTVDILAQGVTIITASQSGNSNYNAATNVQQALTVTSSSSALGTWDFGAVSPGSASPTGVPGNLTISALSQGNNNGTTTLLTTTSGSTGYTGASGSYNAGAAARAGALVTGTNGSAYFEFTLTPSANYIVTITGISFGSRSTSTGPAAFTLRSSLDNYGSDITTGTLAQSWQLQSNSGFSSSSNKGTAITYRIYGYSGSGSPSANTANWRIDDLILTGVVQKEDLVVNSSTTISASNYNSITIVSGAATLGGSVTIDGNLELIGGSLTLGTNTLIIGNSLSRTSGSIDASNSGATVEFTNTSPLTIPDAVFSGNVGNLKLNGSGGVTLGSNTTVTGTLTMTSGKISLNGKTLSADNTSGGNASSYVVLGTDEGLTLTGVTSSKKTFPIGLASSYNPVSITNTGTTRDFTVKLSSGYGTGMNNQNLSVPRLFDITPSGDGTGTNCSIELQINASDYTLSYNNFDPTKTSDIKVGHYNGATWDVVPGSISGSNPYTVTASGISTFSQFAVGNTGAFSNANDIIYLQEFNGSWTGTNSSLPPAATTGTGTWTALNNTGDSSWRRQDLGQSASWRSRNAGIVRPPSNGYAANFHTYGCNSGAVGSLTLTVDLSTPGNKVLSFDHINASGTDTMFVEYSTNSGTNWTELGKYGTGTWSNKSISLGSTQVSNYEIRFRAVADNGGVSDIGLDNVKISVSNVYVTDAGVVSVDVMSSVNGTIFPRATVKNYGSGTATFDVTMTGPGGYTSTKTVTGLANGKTEKVKFDSWSSATGTLTVTTSLTGDENSENNTLTKSVTSVSDNGWAEYTDANNVYQGSGATDDTYLYSIGGYSTVSGEKGLSCYKIQASNGAITKIANLLEPRVVLASAVAGGNLYAIGGRDPVNSPYSYKNTVYMFNGSSWTTDQVPQLTTAYPNGIGWCKAATLDNRFIFVAGGHNGTSAVSNVYMLDVDHLENGWQSMGNMSEARFGGAFSIANDKLIYVAGVNATGLTDGVLVGSITKTDNVPTSISWSTGLNAFPGNGKTVTVNKSEDFSLIREEIETKGSTGNEGDEPKTNYPSGSLYGLDAAPWGTTTIVVGGGTTTALFIPQDPMPLYKYDVSNGNWSTISNYPTPAAGSSFGTVLKSGVNKFFLSSFGKTGDGIYYGTQKWVDNAIGTTSMLGLTSFPDGLNPNKEGGLETEVTIELRESTAPYAVVETKTMMQNAQGFGTTEFGQLSGTKSYYIVVRYGNGIETWSAQPQYFVNGMLNYDFTTAQTQAYGGNMVNVNGKWCIISGDIDQDGKINAMDRGICWNDRGTADVYSDLNGDGVVNELDRAILVKNKNLTVKKPEGAVTSKLKIGKKTFKSSNE